MTKPKPKSKYCDEWHDPGAIRPTRKCKRCGCWLNSHNKGGLCSPCAVGRPLYDF